MRTAIVLALAAVSSQAFGESIFIDNHSFENPTIGSGGFFYSPTLMPGWSATATGGADRGIWHTSAAGKDGLNIAFAYPNNAFAQQLTDTVQANTKYTLDYLMGRTSAAPSGTAQIWAGGTLSGGVVTGGTLLYSRTLSLSQTSMSAVSLSFVTPPSASFIGQPITVRLAGTVSTGSYISFDNIRLATATPEPPRVTGTVQLNDYFGSMVNDLLTVEVWQGAFRTEITNVVVGADGSFGMTPIATGAATLKFKFRTGLKKAVSVNLGPVPITGLTVALTNGDADTSGEVDAADIDLIIANFGETSGSPSFNSFADLDGSDEVDAADIDLAIANFGENDD